MTQTIPINPEVLKWARETMGLSIEDVAHKLRRKSVNSKTVAEWENGKGSPTYSQLEALSYKIFRRPLAIFFFPNPPEEETPQQDFRTLPEYEIALMPPKMRFLIRKAKGMQINLAELYDDTNPGSRQIIQDLQFNPEVSSEEMAKTVREYLGVDLPTQVSWKNDDKALKNWRNVLEENGISVFKDAFKSPAFSGFCLYDQKFPIIFVNNSKAKTRQIFTLFHELAHLLFRTGGIDTRINKYLKYLKGENKLIEVICNGFAGEFLVPSNDFWKNANDLPINVVTFENLANHYCVSREVILRKFRDKNMVSQSYYDNKVKEWDKPSSKGGQSGDYYNNKMSYLGDRYLNQAFSKYFQKQISLPQLAEYIDEKEKNIPGFERRVLHNG